MKLLPGLGAILLATSALCLPAVAALPAKQAAKSSADARLKALYDGYASWDAKESGYFENSRGEIESAGYLTRKRDPEDERQVRISLTARGRSAREKVGGFRGGLLKATGLTQAGLRELREDIVKLRDSLSEAARAEP